jgi:uncharacterized protein (DUF2461 family)
METTDHVCWIDDTYCADCGPITTPLLDGEAAMRRFIDEFADVFDVTLDRQRKGDK